MSTTEERKAATLTVQGLIAEATEGHPVAAAYLDAIAQSARIADDLIDGDQAVSPKQVQRMVGALLIEIPANPFFRAHYDVLWAAHSIAWNAYLDANELESGTVTDQLYAHVLRDTINELLPLVAYLCGGPKRQRAVSRRMRQEFQKEMI